jgi:parallel beta-helix repeat protein
MSSDAGTAYQVEIMVHYGSGIDNEQDVYCNNHSQASFDDIRFTDASGETLLKYWRGNNTFQDKAVFWVRISGNLSESAQTIYMYYDNSAVLTTSSFDDTFIFGDPFDNSSLDTSRWTSVDGVTAYSVNPTEHYLEVTDMTPNQGTGVGFHSRNVSMPSNWVVQDAYSDEGFVMYHESEASRDMFGQVLDLQNSTHVGEHGGVAYIMLHDGWVGDMEVGDSAVIGTDSWSQAWFPPMPYTTRWALKKSSDGVITLSQNGIDRIARANNDTIDRMTWELERYENPGAGFGTERLYAFMIRKHVSPEPLQRMWGGEETKTWIVDDDGPADFSTIQEAINAANAGDTVFVKAGAYSEPIQIDKTLALVGENKSTTVIKDWYIGVYANNVRISDFTIENLWADSPSPMGGCVYIYGYNNLTFSDNTYVHNWQAIRLVQTSGNLIINNYIDGNSEGGTHGGIGFDYANNTIMRNNTITNCEQAISLSLPNYNNTILENNITGNSFGIVMNNLLTGNRFYHNNVINNTEQVYTYYIFQGVDNAWDDGFPSGGNYWSDYGGNDFYSGPYQNETGSDGIGDSLYVIDANNQDNYPLMNPWFSPDVAVLNVSTSKTVVCQGFEMNITAVFENQGNKIEELSTAFSINGTAISSQSFLLKSGDLMTYSFIWKASNVSIGNCTLGVSVSALQGEVDILDNNRSGPWIIISMVGDVTGPDGFPDGKCDIRDVSGLARLFGVDYPDPTYNPDYDLNNDGKINIKDLAVAARHFGERYP